MASPDFGATAFEGTIIPSSTVVQPAVDQSGETLASGLANGLSTLNSIFSDSIQNNAKKNSKIVPSVAADITDNLNMISDAVEQGKLSRGAALTRARAFQNQLMADHPGQESFIQDYINKTMGAGGLVANLSEDTPKEKADKAAAQEAEAFSWDVGNPDAPDKVKVNQYLRHKNDLQKVQDLGTQIDLITKSGGVVDAQLKAKATVALHSAMDSGLPWVQGTIDTGFKQLEGVTNPADRAAIIADVESKIVTQTALVDNMRSTTGIDTSYMTQGYKDLLQNFKDVANGTETTAQYENVAKVAQAKMGAMINMDPNLATALAIDKMVGFTSPATTELITQGTTKLLAGLNKAGQPTDSVDGTAPVQTPDVVGVEPDIVDTFGLLSDQLKTMNADPTKVDKATEAEANAKITGVFKSVARHSAAGMDPRELNSFIQWMADPNTGAWIEGHMKDVAPQLAADAMKAVQDNYQNVGVDLINERWGAASASWGPNAGRPGAPTVELTKAIVPTWNGSGITFTVAPEFKNNAVVVNQAKKLTADISGPLNNMVRAQAHMMGTRDYTKVYNEGFAQRLWVAGEDVPGDITDLKAPTRSTHSGESDGGSGSGSLSWRNNNPGNIRVGSFADAHGAIGEHNGFAVFPSYEDGRAAQSSLLQSPAYSKLNIRQAIARYSPASDGNDPVAYANKVASDLGVDVNTVLSDLSPDQHSKLLDAIQKVEGYIPGKKKSAGAK